MSESKIGPQVKIGDRVAWHFKGSPQGRITGIHLGEHPFKVEWDDGRDDWYKGQDLIFLPPEKTYGFLDE
jgi:hypothetical protein